jgi:hypothetical protein
MRTIGILFTLAVVGGAAPAASLAQGYLPTAVLILAAALVMLLAACIASGWLLFERRALARVASGGPSAAPGAAVSGRTAPALAVRDRWALPGLHASGSPPTRSYVVPIDPGSSLDTRRARQRIAFAALALPASEAGSSRATAVSHGRGQD